MGRYTNDQFYVGADENDPDDIFGADDDDSLGADLIGALTKAVKKMAPPRGAAKADPRMLALFQQFMAQQGSAALAARRKGDEGQKPLPIPPTLFTAGQALDIELRPQMMCRMERLIIDSTIGLYFRILDLKVGTKTQFIASGALPGTMFSEQSVGVGLRGDVAYLGNTVIVSAQNIDTVNSRVLAGAILATVNDD